MAASATWTAPRDFVAGEFETSDIFNEQLRDNEQFLYERVAAHATWTPVLKAQTSDPNIGSTGTYVARQAQHRGLVHEWVRVTYGGSSIGPGSGFYYVVPSVTPSATYSNGDVVGNWQAQQGGSVIMGNLVYNPSYGFIFIYPLTGALASLDHTTYTFVATDTIRYNAVYQADVEVP